MRIAHLDCGSGVSGEMWLGALIDAGASLEGVQAAVDTLGVGNVRLTWARVSRAGVQACAVRVRAPEETPQVRTWRQVREILDFTALDDGIRTRAVDVFKRMTEAEAVVQGRDPEAIEFHEFSMLNMLADVVGTCAAIDELGIEALTVGPIATGTGRMTTLFGEIPLPSPTVVELLRGYTLVGRPGVENELVTTTGAALVAEFCSPRDALPPLTLERTGTGAGTLDLEHPAVLRIHVGTTGQGG